MKEYRLWQLVLYPSLQLLSGFAITRRFGWAWDTGFILISLCLLSVLTCAYMLLYTLECILRAAYWEGADHKVLQPVKPIPNLNVYHLEVVKVKQDTERMFCKALLEFENLTESYWLKGSPSKWQSLGGVGRSDFVKCKDRLTRLGALERTNPQATNSPHRIANRRILEHRASHPTPPL